MPTITPLSAKQALITTPELDTQALPAILAKTEQQQYTLNPPIIGEVVGVTLDNQAMVDYPGNPHGQLLAKSTLNHPPPENWQREQPLSVLILFENNDPTQPVIIGLVNKTLFSPAPNNKNLVLEGKDSITLKSGRSQISLQKNGKVIIKGMDLISRAKRTNKIKGSSVSIN